MERETIQINVTKIDSGRHFWRITLFTLCQIAKKLFQSTTWFFFNWDFKKFATAY